MKPMRLVVPLWSKASWMQSNLRKLLNAENLNKVPLSLFIKNRFLKVLENWQSVTKVFHVDNVMYQNVWHTGIFWNESWRNWMRKGKIMFLWAWIKFVSWHAISLADPVWFCLFGRTLIPFQIIWSNIMWLKQCLLALKQGLHLSQFNIRQNTLHIVIFIVLFLKLP